MRFVLSNLGDIEKVAPQFIKALGDNKMVAFHGEMGAGKTTFINGLISFTTVITSYIHLFIFIAFYRVWRHF